jgi:heterodisulfide reductase subunit B
MEIGYYPGCTLHASSELYDVQTKLVLGALDIQLREIEDWNCCGATSASKTDDFMAIALPGRNLGLARAQGITELVIPCSSCLSRTLVAEKRLAGDDALRNEINAELANKVEGRIKVRSILEVLLPRINELAKKSQKKLTGLKPACYYGCLLTRFPCDMEIPDSVEDPQSMEKILAALGASPTEFAYKTDCCGASASVNDNEVSVGLMAKIMKDAISRGANCFVTTCPMCQLNLDAYQEQVKAKHGISQTLPVYFITELIGVALGQDPKDLMMDRHFVESLGLLKELNLT